MLSSNATFFEARTPAFSNIPRDGSPIYLELDYKSTHDFAISIYANDQTVQTRVVFFKSQTEWTKVYVRLNDVIATLANAFNYNIAIGYIKAQGETSQLLVDNVKLLHF